MCLNSSGSQKWRPVPCFATIYGVINPVEVSGYTATHSDGDDNDFLTRLEEWRSGPQRALHPNSLLAATQWDLYFGASTLESLQEGR